jgi:tRNA-dihydrouridine synthase B
MIGRAALGNPFIFRETVELIEHGRRIPPPTTEERIAAAYQHLELVCSFKGETVAIREMRKHLAWYTRGMRGAARLREEINQATTRQQIDSILDRLSFK